jgi:hypothetical protein
MPQEQGYTPVQLKDGTTLHLLGENLSPDVIRQKVDGFRAKQSTNGPSFGPGPSNTPFASSLQDRLPVATPTTQVTPQMSMAGFTPGNMASNALQTAKGGIGMLGDLLNPTKPILQGPDSLLAKYVTNPAAEQKAYGEAQLQKGNFSEGKTQKDLSHIPLIGPGIGQWMRSAGEGDIGGPTAQLATMEAGGKILKTLKSGADVVTGKKSFSSTSTGQAVQEVGGVGQSAANLKTFLHKSATEKVQPIVRKISELAHDQAQEAMAKPIAVVDNAHPEGFASRGEISSLVKDKVSDVLKNDPTLPPALKKLSEMSDVKDVKRSTGPTVGGRHYDLSDPNDFRAFQRAKAQGVFTPEEIQRMEGQAPTSRITMAELNQDVSDLGRTLGSLDNKGAIGKAAADSYAALRDFQRKTMEGHGVVSDWMDGLSKYKNYVNDFKRSPLKDTLEGENAVDITHPFVGKSAVQVMNILQRYSDLVPPGTLDFLDREIKNHALGENVLNMSKPTRRDFVIAAVSPKMAAVRQGVSRFLRSPSVIEGITGAGGDMPDIPASKVAIKRAQAGGNK